MAQTNHIAIVFDFDFTLTSELSEEPIFRYYKYPGEKFWQDVSEKHNTWKKQIQKRGKHGIFDIDSVLCEDTTYAHVLLDKVRNGQFKNLSLDRLRELGKEIKFHKGVPEFMKEIKKFVKSIKEWKKYNIDVEFYVVSAGIHEMIKGSHIAPYLSGIFATQFSEDKNGIKEAIHVISHTQKTRFIHMISKGPGKGLNEHVPLSKRRIDKRNFIYVGDGATDIPCFSNVKDMGGVNLGVYYDKNSFKAMNELLKQNRIHAVYPADYSKNSPTIKYLKKIIAQIAYRMVIENEAKKK
jgi:phosphoserine phosphatase